MSIKLIVDNLQRIVDEAVGLGADKCPPAPHACPKCEILHLANGSLTAMAPIIESTIEGLGDEVECEYQHTEAQKSIGREIAELTTLLAVVQGTAD
jgi:hypothetical protein